MNLKKKVKSRSGFFGYIENNGYGTNIKSVMEYSIEAVNGLGDYYLKQNCNLAFVTYGGEREVFVPPGTGKQQYFKILKELMNIKTIISNLMIFIER